MERGTPSPLRGGQGGVQTGKELDDETGYSYFGARYYDPNISIWLSVDPLSDKYPGHSPYNYTLNNPIRLIDPDGRDVDETAPGYGAAKRAATPEYNKRGKQTNNDYQPAFAKLFKQFEDNKDINVRFVDDVSKSNSPDAGGTVDYEGTDQGGNNGATRDVYGVYWDPSITKELGTSGMFEEAKHLDDGLAGKFNLKSGSAGLTMQNEYDAKEWVVNNIRGIEPQYKDVDMFKSTHYGYFKKHVGNAPKLINELINGAYLPTISDGRFYEYRVFGYGSGGYQK